MTALSKRRRRLGVLQLAAALGGCRLQVPCAFILLVTGPAAALQKPEQGPPPKPVLTEEEKEILKNRELLENLDLLQDFEKFRYFGYFAAEETADKGKEIQKPAIKKEVKKEEKKKK